MRRVPEQLQFVQFYQQMQVKIGNIWSSFVFAPAQELQLMLARCRDSFNVSDGFIWFQSFTIKTYTFSFHTSYCTVGCDTSTAMILVKDLHLVMEFLGGGSMEDVLAMRRFLPETQVGSMGFASFGRWLLLLYNFCFVDNTKSSPINCNATG